MPAAFTAWYAVGGARKWNSFGSGVPRVVTGVSRLTIAKSTLLSSLAIGPNAVSGFFSSRVSVRPSKWASPAKSSVITGGAAGVVGPGLPDAPVRGGAQVAVVEHAARAVATSAVAARAIRRAITPDRVRG